MSGDASRQSWLPTASMAKAFGSCFPRQSISLQRHDPGQIARVVIGGIVRLGGCGRDVFELHQVPRSPRTPRQGNSVILSRPVQLSKPRGGFFLYARPRDGVKPHLDLLD